MIRFQPLFEPLETLPPIPPILRPSGCGLQLLQTFDFLPDRGERAVLQHDHEVPGFSGSAGCGSTVFLLPTFCSKQAASQHRTAIVEIARSLQRNVADSRFPIAPFLAIRICFGFRASNFGFPAPPGCVAAADRGSGSAVGATLAATIRTPVYGP